jgi:hypothetical protein
MLIFPHFPACLREIYTICLKTPYPNQMLLQYFKNYNLKKGWYPTVSPMVTANWQASHN